MTEKAKASVETILHFTCGQCSLWWSYASQGYRPKEFYCPHCATLNKVEYPDARTHNVVRDTGTAKGRGVFAGQMYHAGETVEISPVRVINAAFDKLPFDVAVTVFDWKEENQFALALGQGTLFNHATLANLRYERNFENKQIRFIAVETIYPGQELTINYNSTGEPQWIDNNWFERMNIKPI